MRSLYVVGLVLAVSLVAMSTAHAESVDGLVMVDSTGKTLGPVLDINGSLFKVPHVPFSVGNSVFLVAVFNTRFAGSGIPTVLHFNSRHCNHQTGQAAAALVDLQTIDPAFWSFVGTDGGTVYVPTPNAQPIPAFNALSRLTVEPNGNVECQDIAQKVSPAIPATPVVNLLTSFTPPFVVDAVGKKGMGSKKPDDRPAH
jgi:hypothetical protein